MERHRDTYGNTELRHLAQLCGRRQPVHSASTDLQNTSVAPNLSTPSYGAWKRIDAGEYAVKFFFFTFDAQTNPSGSGEVKERLTVDGNELNGKIAVTLFDTAGNVVFKVDGKLAASRIEAD